MDEHARQQHLVRVGEHGAQGHRAGTGVHRHFAELQFAFVAVVAAVLELQGDLGRVLAGLLQTAIGQVTAQRQQVAGRLGHVDIDRIELLDGRQFLGLAVADQRAFGHCGAADAPGDRRQHLGVAQVDARPLQFRLGLQAGRARLVIGLLAHRLVLDQFGVAVGQRLAGRQAGLGTLQGCLVHRRIDLVELLPGLDLATLGEQAPLDDAIDLRTNLGDAVGAGTAWQIGGYRKRLCLQGHDAHGGLLLRRGCCFFLTAGQENSHGENGHQGSVG